MKDFLEIVAAAIRNGGSSFRDSMRALFDQETNREDLAGLMWIAAIALGLVLLSMALRAQEKRRMG